MKKIHILFMLLSVAALLCCAGCSVQTKERNEKIRDINFTVLGEENIPDEVKQIIEEKKEKEFKVTYQDNDFLYICVGYGKQDRGGYSITVNDLYLTSNAVYVDTNLVGPEAWKKELYTDQSKESVSYPYVVLKTEYLDKAVVFD